MQRDLLIVGKTLCMPIVEQSIVAAGGAHYLCVDDREAADWLMSSGRAFGVVLLDRGLFADEGELDGWLARTGDADIVISDEREITGAESLLALSRVIAGRDRHAKTDHSHSH